MSVVSLRRDALRPGRRTDDVAFAAFLFVVSLVLPATNAVAQATVLEGETRANQLQYFSIHNAYQGSYSLDEQLDRLNVWELELDVRWRDNALCLGGGTGFYVAHHCADPDGEGWLSTYLDEIAATTRIQEGFFFLNFEMGDGFACLGCFSGPTLPADWAARLQTEITSRVGAAAVYTWNDFVADGRRWPSTQELRRRGKHIAIHVNRETSAGFFFARNNEFEARDPIAVWNFSDQNGGAANVHRTGDRYLMRRYPQATCALESTAETNTAIANGYSFPSTNCIDEHVDEPRFHPPNPMYVREQSLFGPGRGTSDSPYQGDFGIPDATLGLRRALDRVAGFETSTGARSLVEIWITRPVGGGNLQMSGGVPGQDYVIDEAVLLKNRGAEDLVLE